MTKLLLFLLLLVPSVYGAEEKIQFTYKSLKVEFEVNEGTNSVKLKVVDQKDKDNKPKEEMVGLVTYSDEKRRKEFFEAVSEDLKLIKGDIEKDEDKPKKDKKAKKSKWTKEEVAIAVGHSFVEHLSVHGPIRGKIDLKGERLKNYWQQRDKKKKKKKARANIPTSEEYDGITKVADGDYYRKMTRKKNCIPDLGSDCKRIDSQLEEAMKRYLKNYFAVREQQVAAGLVATKAIPPEIKGYRDGLNKRINSWRKECNCLESNKRLVENIEKDWEEATSRIASNIAYNQVYDVWLEWGLVPELAKYIFAKAKQLDGNLYVIHQVGSNVGAFYPGSNEAGSLLHFRVDIYSGTQPEIPTHPPWANQPKDPPPIIDNEAETVQ